MSFIKMEKYFKMYNRLLSEYNQMYEDFIKTLNKKQIAQANKLLNMRDTLSTLEQREDNG